MDWHIRRTLGGERYFRCVAYNLSRVVVCGFLYFIGESLYSYGRDSSFLV